ncbi:hypothetical protein HYH03_011178 [Edaphochlamys debaryana]|uniref:F-box domain-containing protein n=1 Tax=Edaphochlamys debaryana TaxID=47281 RepID=A0A836BV88_9CHLO|nr:hypothetical protein HYH03_011178 [Edaphochlamys debaryana]|eukprot:KAG2490376.1 hypothetical protein HYH03_011178 [Edaphochlamys debaryana]
MKTFGRRRQSSLGSGSGATAAACASGCAGASPLPQVPAAASRGAAGAVSHRSSSSQVSAAAATRRPPGATPASTPHPHPHLSLPPPAGGVPAAPSTASRSQPDWAALPDGPLAAAAAALPAEERPRCRLVCRGWAAAVATAVEDLALSVSLLPREASRQLAAAHRRFGGCGALTLRFANFLLPSAAADPHQTAPDPHQPSDERRAAVLGGEEKPGLRLGQQRGRRAYARPLLGAGVGVGPGSGRAGGIGGGGGGGGARGGVFCHVTRLTLCLGAAGLTTLPLDAHYRLPALVHLEINGFQPPPANGLEPPPPLGLSGFPALEHLALSGLLSYKVLLEVAQVTTLQRLTLSGAALVGRSDFVYLAALRRLSSLSHLQSLSIDGPLPWGTDAAATLRSLSDSLTSLTSLHVAPGSTRTASMDLPPPAGGAAAGAPAAGGEEQAAAQQQDGGADQYGMDELAVPVSSFARVRHLSVRAPSGRRLPDTFWVELAALPRGGGTAETAAPAAAAAAATTTAAAASIDRDIWAHTAADGGGGGSNVRGSGGGGRGDGSTSGGGGGGLVSLSVMADGSGIVDELPACLTAVTELRLQGVQLDSLSLLSRLRSLASLTLALPPDGCDPARRHSPALLSALTGLTGECVWMWPYSSSPPPLRLAAAARRQEAAAAAAAAGRSFSTTPGYRHAGLCALSRGLRRLASLSFRGTLQLSEAGAAAAFAPGPGPASGPGPGPGAGLSRLTCLRLSNDSDAPAVLPLTALPPSLEILGLASVTLVLRPATGSSAGASGTAAGAKPHGKGWATAIAGGGEGAAAAAAGVTSSVPAAVQTVLLPRCRVLHLDYCRGASAARVLRAMAAAAGGGGGSSCGGAASSAGGGGRNPPAGSAAAAAAAGSGPVLEELRLCVVHCDGVTQADAAAVAALPRLRKLQVGALGA